MARDSSGPDTLSVYKRQTPSNLVYTLLIVFGHTNNYLRENFNIQKCDFDFDSLKWISSWSDLLSSMSYIEGLNGVNR